MIFTSVEERRGCNFSKDALRSSVFLKLSQSQKDSIYVYSLELSKKQQDIFKNTDDRKAAFEKLQPLRSSTDMKIKSFLNAEQSKSYDALQKEMLERREQRQKSN